MKSKTYVATVTYRDDGFYKHFPHGQYDAYLSKDCLFVKRETAENKCALNSSDEIVEVSLVEVEGEA
ncbi:TPA: hypothetical protein LWL07_002767 [Listeria monocytogenes]|nr:hypothetical protein [Listeria monocytogenes]EHD5081663.1 hypothetical protein [Listeria monocytogenes]EJX9024289.1 hypothetical protein [Listeria monocytogenes]HAA5949874.1 hypothetical protein [Listeria monocytogenes]HBM3946350.1 hypothetical protein [Listeria monocytogenes]